VHVLTWTPEKRREIFEAGRDLFVYCRGTLGFDKLTDHLHWDYCQFLQRPSLRKLVFLPRGAFNSSIGTVGYASHCSIYIPDHSTKLVEASSDNAKKNHFLPIYWLFTESRRADFLYFLYGDYGDDTLVDSHGVPLDQDMRRIPENFAGWNSEQIDFIRRGELTLPAITYGGINTTYEGYHGDLVLGDDLEGADEDKAIAPNDDAWRFVDQRAVPLLKEPAKGRILIIGTLHGPDPVVLKIKEREREWRAKGNPPVWDIFWRPIIDSSGTCVFPERYPPETLSMLRQSKTMWKTQYMGELAPAEDSHFDPDQIRANAWQWVVPNRLLSYRRKRFARSEVGSLIHDESGFPKIEEERATINPALLRPFMHCDPKHVKGAKYSDAEAAIVVVGVNWDQHVFELASWTGDVSLEEFAEKIYHYYRKYRPWRVSMGAVGAEHWFVDYAKMLERGKYRQIPSLPNFGLPPLMLPKLTARLEMAKSHSQQAKDDWIVRQLESWYSFGLIHHREQSEAFYSQIAQVGMPTGRRDLIDALAQGPKTWNFPRSDATADHRRSLITRTTTISPADPDTGYFNPWPTPGQLPPPAMENPHHPHTPDYRNTELLLHSGEEGGPLRVPSALPDSQF
jgi:hypothetical protein